MSDTSVKKSNKRLKILIIAVSAVTAAIIALGVALGIATAVTNASAAARLDGVMMDAGEVNYFASRYKSLYIRTLTSSGVNATDTEAFWNKTDEKRGKTYGTLLTEGTKAYIADMIAAVRIYLNYNSFGATERATVEKSCMSVVEYKGGGSIASFNESVAAFGFDYDDFKSASEKIYMASLAETMLYGADGSGLASFTDECDKYYAEYTCVKLLFFRTNTKIAEDGSIANLTDEEIAERAASIAKIREYIANHNAGAEDAISPETFEVYYEKSDGDPQFYDTGYYLHPSAEQTGYFREAFPEIYEVAMSLEIGEFGEAEWDVDLDPETSEMGVCFIYRDALAKSAYSDNENIMFSDFYSDAAQKLYSGVVAEFAPLVEFTDNYDALDVIKIPSNHSIYVKSFN